MNRAVIAERATLASERAKELMSGGGGVVSRARSLVLGDAQLFSVQPKVDDLRHYLDSDLLHDKRNAMKRIIAQMCKGNDMSTLFANVVKNIHSPSIELRKLIYFYVTHYAEERPNEALLSISAFQKDLLNPSMHVRSLALRMLSTVRIPAIHSIVMVAVKNAASDPEPFVRKTAAISLAQMHAISGKEADMASMEQLLQELLADKSMEVASAAALSFVEICPDKVEFIHPVYRYFCRSLLDSDEWGQVVLLHVLMRYARTQFCDPNSLSKCKSTQLSNGKSKKVNLADDADGDNSRNTNTDTSRDENGSEEDESSSGSSSTSHVQAFERGKQSEEDANIMMLDSDHRLLLDSVRPLFMSLNSAVVVAATSLFYHCAPRTELELCVRPLLRLLAGLVEHQAIVLSAIYTIVLSRPEPFIPCIKEFYLLPYDVKDVRELKINIMSKLATQDNVMDLLQEFRVYVRSFYVDCVLDAVRGLGLIVARLPTCASRVMRLMVQLLSHKNAKVVSESIFVLRLLVMRGTNKGQICQLVYRLLCQVMNGEIASASAKANILWLVGESIKLHRAIAAAAPDCFRVLLKTFVRENTDVKKQVLTLGLKIWMFLDGSSAMADRFRKLFFHALELARFDDDYDVRDCGRLLQSSVDRQSETFTALKNMLLGEKPYSESNDPYAERTRYQLGTMSHLFGTPLFNYRELPPWSDVSTDPLLRGPPSHSFLRHHHPHRGDRGGEDDGSDESMSGSASDVCSTEEGSYSESGFFSSTSTSESQQFTSSTSSSSDDSSDDDDDDGSCSAHSSSSIPPVEEKRAAAAVTRANCVRVNVAVRHVDPTAAATTTAGATSCPPRGADDAETNDDPPRDDDGALAAGVTPPDDSRDAAPVDDERRRSSATPSETGEEPQA